MSLRLIPVTRDQAMEFVARVHRHHGRPVGYRFAVGVADGERLCGVAMAGRPVARAFDPATTFEVTRVATDGTRNACSMLYGACWRAARAMGYSHGVTYTQEGECGASLRAAGWVQGGMHPSRRRTGNGNDGVTRFRWEIPA